MTNMTEPITINSVVRLNNGQKIPRLGLGVFKAPPGPETENAVYWALEAGYRHVDTAALYGNEHDVGAAIKKSGIPRDQVWITTKIWNTDQGYQQTLAAAQNALKKIDTEYIDLLLLHSPLPGKSKRLESWQALQDLVRQDKVKSIGVSNYGVHHIKELQDTDPDILPAVNQIEIHPWLLRHEINNYCKDLNIVMEAYSPLTKAKKLSDPLLVKIAENYQKTPAQILIRWSLQRGFVVLPKSTNKERIVENASVYDFEISQEDMDELSSIGGYFVTAWDPTTAP